MPTVSEFDVVIVGSGFAGSLTATILAQSGLRVALLDRAKHPRFAIGESSTPTANALLRELAQKHGLQELLPLCKFGPWRAAYPQLMCGLKRGFSYFSHTAGEEFRSAPDHRNELLVAASADDFLADTQWLRSDVDEFCFQLAQSRGCRTYEETTIENIERTAVSEWQIGTSRGLLRCRFLIDATGNAEHLRLAERFSNRTEHVEAAKLQTRSRTIFGHFANLPRWEEVLQATSPTTLCDFPFRCDDAALHHVLEEGWFWWIRFANNVTSVGIVLDEQRCPLDLRISSSDEWQRVLSRYPSLSRAFEHAELIAPQSGLVRTERLQRRASAAVGDDWVLLPHSVGFVDPLHSTGIACSLAGVDRVTSALLQDRDWSSECVQQLLHHYERATFAELDLIDRFVSGAYQAIAERSFRKFVAYSMTYFAAATSWEQRRCEQHSSVSLPMLFLADDPQFVRTVDELKAALATLSEQNFEQLCRERLAEFNRVGLFAPARPNMYGQTAAPESA